MENAIENELSGQQQVQGTVIPTTDFTQSQEQVVLPENSSSESGAGQTSQENVNAGTKTPEAAKPPKTPWYQQRINELTRERKESEEARQRDVARYESELLTARASNQNTQANNQQASNVDIDRLVQERTTAQMKQQSFNDACNKVYSAGQNEFRGTDGNLAFDAALAQLGLIGQMPPHFVEAATALDGGHKVLYHLGNNLDLASELLSLPPVQLAIRMAALNTDLGKPKSNPVSRAPAPIQTVSGSGVNDDLSKASLDSFMERRNRDKPIRK